MTAAAVDQDAVRGGDERAEAGDWVGAVRRWRAAAGDGNRDAAERLRAFVRHFDPAGAAALPRRALRPLAICGETALLGALTVILGNRVEGGRDAVLLWVGWASFAVSAGAALLFATRSGRLDGAGPDSVETAELPEVAARAEAVAARLATGAAGNGATSAPSGEGRA